MRVITFPEYGQIELSDAEICLVNLVSEYLEQIAIIAALKTFCNAEKVVEVLRISGKLSIPHASYTLYPIISQIGNRTASQYVQDVDKAVREYHEQYFKEHPQIAKFYRGVNEDGQIRPIDSA